MKLLISALLAASTFAVATTASAGPMMHHRHQVCTMRHHHRMCVWR